MPFLSLFVIAFLKIIAPEIFGRSGLKGWMTIDGYNSMSLHSAFMVSVCKSWPYTCSGKCSKKHYLTLCLGAVSVFLPSRICHLIASIRPLGENRNKNLVWVRNINSVLDLFLNIYFFFIYVYLFNLKRQWITEVMKARYLFADPLDFFLW